MLFNLSLLLLNVVISYKKQDPLNNINSMPRAVYSLRRLNAINVDNVNCIRVRRSSDNSETNIGFLESGDLDTTSLLLFCGSGSGFITIWYNQSSLGDGQFLFQSTASRQPQIVQNGSLIVNEYGKPQIKFDGIDDLLILNGGRYFTSSISNISVVHRPISTPNLGHGSLLSISTLSGLASYIYYGADPSVSGGFRLSRLNNNSVGLRVGGNSPNMWIANKTLVTNLFNYPSSLTVFMNENKIILIEENRVGGGGTGFFTPATVSNLSNTISRYYLGVNALTTNIYNSYYNGFISEFILSFDNTSVYLNGFRTNQYLYWGITP